MIKSRRHVSHAPLSSAHAGAGDAAAVDTALLQGELRLAGRLDQRCFTLLHALSQTGSLRRAAQAAGYTYKGAWLLLEQASNFAHVPLVKSDTGGTRLTVEAQNLLEAWTVLRRRHAEFLRTQDEWLLSQPKIAHLLRRLAMKTSARNQFSGSVSEVTTGPVTAQASVTLSGGQAITATMTAAAAKRLQLKVGQDAIAIVKSSEVVLVTDFAGYELSARNQLSGSISRVQRGAVSSLVGVTLPGGQIITASVTNDAVDALGLAVGQAVTAVFKAYAVMLAVKG